MSHDNNGDNYMSSAEYFADMSQLSENAMPRYTGNIRKKQLQNAAKTYALRNPLVNRSAVARYQLDNHEVGRAARSRYEHTNPRQKVERLTLLWKIMVNSGMTYNPDLAYEAEKIYSSWFYEPQVQILQCSKMERRNPRNVLQ